MEYKNRAFWHRNKAYCKKFNGLLINLKKSLSMAEPNIKQPGAEMVNLGMIDSPRKAFEAGQPFKQ